MAYLTTARMKSQAPDLEPHTSRQIIKGHDFEVRWLGGQDFRFFIDNTQLDEKAFDAGLRLATSEE